MKNKESNRSVKLGVFVVIGIALFLTAVFYLGKDGNVFNKTFTVSAVFKNVEGLKEGDNVWLSGVKIGMVKRVRIISDGKVMVELSLKDKQNQFIKKNATATVGSDGLVGNKIVVIRPGNANEIIHDNDTINSFSPTDTQELFNLAKEVGGNAKSITDDFKTIAQRLNKGEGLLGELLTEGPVSKDLRTAIVSLKQAGENTNQATNDLKRILAEVNNGDGLVAKLITDTAYANTFESALNNVEQLGKNTKQMSEELKKVISKVNDNNNAVGVLLADTVFANKLKLTLDNAESASVKLDENMEALQHNFLLRGYFRKQKKQEKKK